MRSLAPTRPVPALLSAAAALLAFALPGHRHADGADGAEVPHRSPIALALSADGKRLLTANQTAGTASLVDTVTAKVVAEVPVGDKPAGVALSRDGKRGVVANWYGYDVAVLDVGPDSLKVVGRVEVGPEPRGVAVARDGKTAYVAVGAANEVARVDLDTLAVTGRLTVGREPRGLALSPDGTRLLVGNARGRSLTVIATGPWSVERTIPAEVENLRQVAFSPDGTTGFVASMTNRGFATTSRNIDLGWVLGQRITKVAIDGSDDFATLSIDPQGKAAGDAHGMAVSPDGMTLAVSLGGTHEVMLFQADRPRLPWRSGSARDLIAGELLYSRERFRRIETGGRPTELAFSPDGKALYVANYLENAVQVIDTETDSLINTIPLGGPEEVSEARRGEALFHDARRSFNQWYSCNTCHSDGHTNGLDFDTLNDGRQDLSTRHDRSRKKVPTLRRVTHTGPWTWHGWQEGLDDAAVESFTKSMQGPRPKPDEVKAIVAFLGTLEYPKNPHREKDGGLSESARRGEAIFRSSKAACSSCHGGTELTDGRIHVAGLEEPDDKYRGYNPPSLRGVYDKDPYLHDGRSKTLADALKGPHAPDAVTGLGDLSDAEVDDLIAYLKTL